MHIQIVQVLVLMPQEPGQNVLVDEIGSWHFDVSIDEVLSSLLSVFSIT